MRPESLEQRAARLARLADAQATLAELRLEAREREQRDFMRARRLEHAQHVARRAARDRGGALPWLLTVVAVFAAGTIGGHYAELRTREAAALACARASDGADSSIADCYASRDLPIPEDL